MIDERWICLQELFALEYAVPGDLQGKSDG